MVEILKTRATLVELEQKTIRLPDGTLKQKNRIVVPVKGMKFNLRAAEVMYQIYDRLKIEHLVLTWVENSDKIRISAEKNEEFDRYEPVNTPNAFQEVAIEWMLRAGVDYVLFELAENHTRRAMHNLVIHHFEVDADLQEKIEELKSDAHLKEDAQKSLTACWMNYPIVTTSSIVDFARIEEEKKSALA